MVVIQLRSEARALQQSDRQSSEGQMRCRCCWNKRTSQSTGGDASVIKGRAITEGPEDDGDTERVELMHADHCSNHYEEAT